MKRYRLLDNYKYSSNTFVKNKIYDESEVLYSDSSGNYDVTYYVKNYPQDWELVKEKFNAVKYLEELFLQENTVVFVKNSEEVKIFNNLLNEFFLNETNVGWDFLIEKAKTSYGYSFGIKVSNISYSSLNYFLKKNTI